MRILLVTWTNNLLHKLKILNPANEYCAIVVDDPDIAKQILKNVPQLREKIFPFYELKECIENNYYDLTMFVSEERASWSIANKFMKYGLPREKFFNLRLSINGFAPHFLEKNLRYYKEHAEDFEMFATGTSYTSVGLDVNKFKYKLFNLGQSSQDLYYDYQIAKFILNGTGGGGNIKYALIGLAPYSFHYDESKSFFSNCRLFKYVVAFNDVHNFSISNEHYTRVFKKEFLNIKLPIEKLTLNYFFPWIDKKIRYMDFKARLDTRKISTSWNDKNYPETVKENVQILDDYLTLCENNNVRPIMFLPPMTEGHKKYFSRQKLDEFYYLIRDAQKKHPSALFLDGWKIQGFGDSDFRDASHLNIQGATKFSTSFNNAIENLEKG